MSAAPFGYGKVRASFTDIGLLIGRLAIGGVVFMHGWQKFTQMGYSGVVEMFSGIGAPIPQLTAALVILLEVVGAAALAVGIFTRVVAVLIALNMVGALLLLHLPNGFFVADGGYELVALIAGTSLIYAFAGPGRISIDAIFLRVMSKRGDKAEKKAAAEATTMLDGIATSPASAPRSTSTGTGSAKPSNTGSASSPSTTSGASTTSRDTAAGKQSSSAASGSDRGAASSGTTRPATSTGKSDASTTGAEKPADKKPADNKPADKKSADKPAADQPADSAAKKDAPAGGTNRITV